MSVPNISTHRSLTHSSVELVRDSCIFIFACPSKDFLGALVDLATLSLEKNERLTAMALSLLSIHLARNETRDSHV